MATIHRRLGEPHALPPMTTTNTVDISDFIAADRAQALDEAGTASQAILDLQETDTWGHLPIEPRQAICAARVLLARVARGLDGDA